MKRIISLILTLALAAVFYIPASASAGSLDGWLTGYSGTLEAKAELDTTEYHSGSASVKLSRKTAEKSNVYMNFQQSVPVEEGKTYQYGFWAKAKNINRISTLIDWGARAYLNPITSTYDWTYFSFKYTHNKASGNVAFKIIVDGPSAAFWIDDVEFCEYNDGMLGPNLIKNPGFEGTDSADSDKVEEDSLLEDEFTKESYYNEIAASSIIPVYKKTDIVIDGDISDWDGATKLELPKLETQVQEYSTSEIDAKVSMSFAYDENYFYFLTTAEDDVFYDLSGSEYWQGDSIQLCLSQEGESFGAEIGYSYSDNGGGKYALDFGENQMSGLLLNTSRSGNTTYYESAIPWELYYGEFKDEILFSAIYNDNDGSGRKYAIQLSEGISEGKVNTDFPIFRMVPEECGFFAWSEGPDSATVYEINEYKVCILNNSDADKEFLVNAGEETKTVAISAGMGKKVEFDIIFEEAGNQKQDFVVSDGTHSQIFNHSAAVVATPDFYDEALEGLQIKADEIKDLIGQCNDRGISTDYEEPAAFILERFIDYIREDADREYYDIMEYTFEELERIYNEAKGNLEAYLAGEKEALETPKFVTGEIDIDGLTHWAYTEDSDGKEEQRPVFFVGYGHFDEAKEDIPNFKALGVNSFQNEIGTYDIITDRNNVPGYSTKANNFKALYELIEDRQQAKSGKKLLKITSTTPQQNNCYSAIYQGVQVEPGETYEFGGTIKATNANKFWMAMEEWPDSDGRKQLGGTYDWKDVSFEYTVPDNVTIAYFQVFIEDTADEILIDDLWVRKKGTKTNLLSNGDFEGKYEDFGDNKRASVLKANDIIDALKSAEKNDVSMSLLISPHYWPTAVIEDESVKDLSGSLQWMNMKSSEVRQVMEKYLEYLLPEVKKYDSLTNICITNEPTLISSRTEYYQEDFIEYLKGIYDNDLAEYNRINGTSFENFEEIKMPQDTTPSVLLYDWKQFNDALVYEWSSWVAELVNEYLPDIPVHAKIMQNTYEDDASLRIHMLYGSKIENYAEFSDVHGCDAFNYYNPVKQPQKLGNNTNPTTTNALEKTMWYDLLTSVKFMPVYNTEDHIISDSSKTYNHDIALHVGADIWQGGLHGRGNSVIWVWSRKYQDSALANSILTRPDALYEVSRSSLDLNRLSYEAAAIADKAPDIALLWSDTSRVYQNSYMNNLYKAYESSVYNGQKTGFVSEEMIDRLYNYEVVICPNVTNVKEDVARKVAEYASSGRTLVLMGDGCFSADEHNQPLPQEIVQEIYDNSILIETVNDAFKMTSPDNLKKQFADIFDSKGLRRVRVVNTETGLDADQVEFIYTDYNGKLLVNLVLYDWTSDQNVKILVDGEPVTSSLELRSMETCGENIELKSFEPILLEIEEGGVNNEGITLQVGNPVMISNGMRSLIDPQSHDTVPVIVNDRTMLPARAVVEEIGGEVMWNEETRETTLMYNGIELKLTIDSYTAYVNNKEKTLDSAPVIINDRTMLPIRFIAENFNLDVSWDDAGKLVTIIK